MADGRSNQPPLGRFSLGTSDRKSAIEALAKLDLLCAIKQGKASTAEVASAPKSLSITEGCRQYQEYVARPAVIKGCR